MIRRPHLEGTAAVGLKAVVLLGLGFALMATLLSAFRSTRPPFALASVAGCYAPTSGSHPRKVVLTETGEFRYGAEVTEVSADATKNGPALVARKQLLLDSNGEVATDGRASGYVPLDLDLRGFAVGDLHFRKGAC